MFTLGLFDAEAPSLGTRMVGVGVVGWKIRIKIIKFHISKY